MTHKISAARRIAYFLRTGYLQTGERVNPDFPDENFFNHLKVYKFAAQFAAGKRVLDVGCGTGYGSDYLSPFTKSITGIDISKQAIRLATSKYPGITFRIMDAHSLEFPDASFDFIISTENFEHLTDQPRHLREVRRVLRKGGMAMIASPNPEMFAGISNPYHHKENSYQELIELLPAVFSEVEIIENSLPHNLDRPHGALPSTNLDIFGQSVDTTHLSNTHSFFCFCR